MRRRNILIQFLLLIFCVISCDKIQQPVSKDLPEIREKVLEVNERFKARIEDMLTLETQPMTQGELKEKFHQLRLVYKEMEWAVEYFLPHSARFINGPALPEIEFDENIEIEPEGLQVLEELIYDDADANHDEIVRMLKKLKSKSDIINTNIGAITMNNVQVFDALRMQVFRISSLSVANFDTPVSGRNLEEMPVALQSVANVLDLLKTGESAEHDKLQKEIQASINFLKKNNDRNSFDYLTFISENLNAVAASMLDFKAKENIPDIIVQSPLKQSARTFYSENAFDVDAFVPGEAYNFSPEKAALGKKLFNDNLLSNDNSRSCATCHHSDKAFTDGLPRSLSLAENPLDRNSPSLNYAAFQHGQFWDMRSADLEMQTTDVITNKDEMHGDMKEIVVRLERNPKYAAEIKRIYKTDKIEAWQVNNLLASYVRSLPGFSSDFDRFMRGDKSALTAEQKEGFNLFVGKANCASCHFLPLFNGTVPPTFNKTEQEILGTAVDDTNRKLDIDPGRGRFHSTIDFLQMSFKTPTVRNIEKSAPYMHNGGYRTLKDVMLFYNEGGGKGFGFKVDNQTLAEDKLNLTDAEIDKIISFMNALTDK